MIQPRFTSKEATTLHALVAFALLKQDNDTLRQIKKKLEATADQVYCSHCRGRPTGRRNGLCDPCNTFQHNRGRLPPPEVLLARSPIH